MINKIKGYTTTQNIFKLKTSLTGYEPQMTGALQLPLTHFFPLIYCQDCSWHERTWGVICNNREKKKKQK